MSETQAQVEWQPAIVVPIHHDGYWNPDDPYAALVRGKRVRIRECDHVNLDHTCKKWFSVHPDDTPEGWTNWILCEASILTD